MKLSNQAIGAIMLALQKSLTEQTDIVPVFQNFELMWTDEGIAVKNPPIVKSLTGSDTTMLPSNESMMKMKKAEILNLGKKMGVNLKSSQTKAQLVETLRSNQ